MLPWCRERADNYSVVGRGCAFSSTARGRNTCEASAVAPTGLPGALIERQESLTAPAGLMPTLTTLSVSQWSPNIGWAAHNTWAEQRFVKPELKPTGPKRHITGLLIREPKSYSSLNYHDSADDNHHVRPWEWFRRQTLPAVRERPIKRVAPSDSTRH